MSIDAFIKDSSQVRKLVLMLIYITGGTITSYYLFSFKVDKFGLYFRDSDQLGLSIGVGILIFGWFLKNWKNL
ncbi:MAG: hypothetical protein OEY09_17915 [Gammaproteobacteria bacterium]|nr:hypothetical protein [Gammaproteobacteria bacterium]